VTAAGARELARRLAAPLTDAAMIRARHDAVGLLVDDTELREETREYLRSAPDIARSRARLSVERGGPRDLAAIRDGIAAAHRLSSRLGRELPPKLLAIATILPRPMPPSQAGSKPPSSMPRRYTGGTAVSCGRAIRTSSMPPVRCATKAAR
jgi:DNA mismatch repair protein MutS